MDGEAQAGLIAHFRENLYCEEEGLRQPSSCVRRNGSPELVWSSRHNCSGCARKTFTTCGSNCVPEKRSISSRAAEIGRAFLYGRSDIIASSVSATAKILAPSGI